MVTNQSIINTHSKKLQTSLNKIAFRPPVAEMQIEGLLYIAHELQDALQEVNRLIGAIEQIQPIAK